MVRIIQVVEYRSEWAAEFVAESIRLRDVFGKRALEIHRLTCVRWVIPRLQTC